MARFSYLIPRGMIVILLMTACWLGKDMLLRPYLVSQLEKTLGSKVELAGLQTNFETGRVCLKDLKIVDPKSGLHNLLQADMAYLKLDWQRLWNREFVIVEGNANGLRFNAPRTEFSGEVSGSDVAQVAIHPSLNANLFSTSETQLNLAIENIGKRLIDGTKPGLVNVADPKLNSESISREIVNRWKNDLAELETLSKELAPELVRLKESVTNQHKYFHALRDKEQIQNAHAEIESIQARAVDLKNRVNLGLDRLSADQKTIQEASDQDYQSIENFKFENQADNQLISELLLSRESRELVDEIRSWIGWFQEAIPETEFGSVGKSKGSKEAFRSVEFALPRPVPSRGMDWTIQQIELDGSGWLAHHHLNFVGTAYNLSGIPNQSGQPARFELRALGKNNLLITCLVDRSGEENVTNLKIQFQDMEIGRKPMGEPGSMLISSVSSRRANAEANLEIKGKSVNGRVELKYNGVVMQLDRVAEVLGGVPVQVHLNQGLTRINHFHSNLELNGTVDQLEMKLTSDLGQQLEQLLDSDVAGRFVQEKQKFKQRIQTSNQEVRRYIEQSLLPKLTQINQMMASELDRIAEIKDSMAPIGESGWSKLR